MTSNHYNNSFMWQFGIPMPINKNTKWFLMAHDNIHAITITHDDEKAMVIFNKHDNHCKYSIYYEGNHSYIYDAICHTITKYLNKSNVYTMERICDLNEINNIVAKGLILRSYKPTNSNTYSKNPPHIPKDIRNQFLLWEHHDKCIITSLEDNKIHFYTINDNKRRYILTKSFCDALFMSEEETMYWVLKYGTYLPKYLNQL